MIKGKHCEMLTFYSKMRNFATPHFHNKLKKHIKIYISTRKNDTN